MAENPNPTVFQPIDVEKLKAERAKLNASRADGDERWENTSLPLPLCSLGCREPIDALEVYEMIRHINDPEHPLTLEQLKGERKRRGRVLRDDVRLVADD